jgi:hypothetical protein
VHVKRALLRYPTPPKGVYELWDRMEVEWNEIIVETYQNLIESMPRKQLLELMGVIQDTNCISTVYKIEGQITVLMMGHFILPVDTSFLI